MSKSDIRTLSTLIAELAKNETIHFGTAHSGIRIQIFKGFNPVYTLEQIVPFVEIDQSNLDQLAFTVDRMIECIRTDSERK